MTEFRGEVSTLQLEVLDRIGWRRDSGIAAYRRASVELDVVVDAIQAEVVLPQVDTIHEKEGAVCGAGVTAGLILGSGNDAA